MRKHGFTLVEILAVLVLMSLLAAGVGLSLSGRMELANRAEVLDRLRALDSQARLLAENSPQSFVLVFDLSRQTIGVEDENHPTPEALSLMLPDHLQLDHLMAFGHTFTSGSVSLPLSRHGTSPSYAFSLTDAHGQRATFLVAGLTGQIIQMANEQQLHNILRLAQGPDTP